MFASLRSALHRLVRRLFRPSALERPAPEATPFRREVERLVGHAAGDLALYEQALAHRSLLRGQADSHLASNERLEFLGDAVLGFVVAEHLYHHFPERDEGFLTRLRAKLVSGQALARTARRVGLGGLIRMSEHMAQADGRQNASILADAFEAVIGALYLDLGLGAARAFIHRTILAEVNLDKLATRRDNHKSLLLEFAQARAWPQPTYRVVEEHGPSHDKVFTVEVVVGETPCGRGRAGSKKQAEQQAAAEALERLQEDESLVPVVLNGGARAVRDQA